MQGRKLSEWHLQLLKCTTQESHICTHNSDGDASMKLAPTLHGGEVSLGMWLGTSSLSQVLRDGLRTNACQYMGLYLQAYSFDSAVTQQHGCSLLQHERQTKAATEGCIGKWITDGLLLEMH